MAPHVRPLPDRAARLAGGTLKVWDEVHLAARSPLLVVRDVVPHVHMAAGQLLLWRIKVRRPGTPQLRRLAGGLG